MGACPLPRKDEGNGERVAVLQSFLDIYDFKAISPSRVSAIELTSSFFLPRAGPEVLGRG